LVLWSSAMTSKHAFANQVIRDLIETQAEFSSAGPWTPLGVKA
jgi:hypothetical protein